MLCYLLEIIQSVLEVKKYQPQLGLSFISDMFYSNMLFICERIANDEKKVMGQ